MLKIKKKLQLFKKNAFFLRHCVLASWYNVQMFCSLPTEGNCEFHLIHKTNIYVRLQLNLRMLCWILCLTDRASYNLAIIIQQDATQYSLFKSVNCSTCFGWYFTRHQELITLYLQYLALMRTLLLPVVNVSGREPARHPLPEDPS